MKTEWNGKDVLGVYLERRNDAENTSIWTAQV